jgi:hypothetical protein
LIRSQINLAWFSGNASILAGEAQLLDPTPPQEVLLPQSIGKGRKKRQHFSRPGNSLQPPPRILPRIFNEQQFELERRCKGPQIRALSLRAILNVTSE